MRSFSSSVITSDLRSAPIITLSLASSNSTCVTMRLLRRAAIKAASLTRFIRSAPEKPGVPRAMVFRLTSGASGTLRTCTFRICSRPTTSGFGTTTWRSKRPGRSSAGSSTSGRLVAAIKMMPSLASKPSISTSSWFSVCSRSSLPPPRPAPRWRPTASISSMKMMQGAFFFACSNMSRTRLAPTPTNISTKSEPEMVKNGTLASPAMARASSVLPVPGGPTSNTPRGMRPPSRWNFAGIAQEFDDLLQVELGFVDAGHILEGDAAMRLGQKLGARLAEAERLAAGALHLARQENPHADQRDERQPGNQQRDEPGHVLGLRPRRDRNALVVEALHQGRIARRIGLEGAAVGEGAVDFRTLDEDVAHAALIDLVEQLREGNVLRGRVLAGILEQREQRQQQQDDNDPQGEIPQIGVHRMSSAGDRAAPGGSLRAGKSWRLHVPAIRQCRRRPPPCQGKPTMSKPFILRSIS